MTMLYQYCSVVVHMIEEETRQFFNENHQPGPITILKYESFKPVITMILILTLQGRTSGMMSVKGRMMTSMNRCVSMAPFHPVH